MKTLTLLVIEDEAAIRDMLHFSLSENEFTLIDAEDTIKAIKVLANQIPDLILLDWMLPGKSGIAFIKWIKQQDNLCNIPIIMLSAKAEEENKVKGLMTGADDYITKPFSPNELSARIKTVLRRGTLVLSDNKVKFKQMTLDASKHQVSIKQDIIKLTPIECKMLYFFMRHSNKIYTRDQLISYVWGTNIYINDRTVDVHIRRLRDKLKKHNYDRLIKTIRGSGYQFSEDDN